MEAMKYYKCRTNKTFTIKEGSADEEFAAIEMMKLIDKQYRKSKYMKKKEGL